MHSQCCPAASGPWEVPVGRSRDAHVALPMVQKDATAWERWVYLFAQLRQLAVLAPRLPTKDPQLRGSAYEMVLHAFLLSPADHPRLLKLLETWPPHLYSLPALTQAVVQRYAPQQVQAVIDWEPALDSSVPLRSACFAGGCRGLCSAMSVSSVA